MARYLVGCDIGGTFTDVIASNRETGELVIAKSPSTPPLYVEGIINALKKAGINPQEIEQIRHGATITTNAILERRGAKVGLIVTEGFRGIFPGEKSERMGAFELNWEPPKSLIPQRDVFGVRERVSPEGTILTPLNEEDVRRAARIFKKRGMGAIVICYMDSFMNPVHENRSKEIVKEECPGLFVCTSCEVLPKMLETDRWSTTVLNAYIGPVMERYMAELMRRLKEWGYEGEVLITHSGGGVMTSSEVLRLPVKSCHSSPVSGVVGLAGYVGKLAGFDNVIAFETGGTTNDVSMIFDSKPVYTMEWRILWNVPCAIPSIETAYIGAGGGSIAWVDTGGMLRIGPRSAGAKPGPACFGKGGTEPTNTDAQLVLGRLSPSYFLGGDMPLYPELARKAIKEKVADKFGWSVEEAANNILKVSINNMMIAIRLQSVSRGWDPRDFALVSYGGGGPFYGAYLAKELSIPTVIIPTLPGYGSAFGAIRVPMLHEDMVPFWKTESQLDYKQLNRTMNELVKTGREMLRKGKIPEDQMKIQRLAEVKYFDQARPLTLDFPEGEIKDLKEIKKKFSEAMIQEYKYDLPSGLVEVEICSLKVRAVGMLPMLELKKAKSRQGTLKEAIKEKRKVYFEEAGGFVEVPIYQREKLPYGVEFSSPTVIEQPDTTTVIPPGMVGKVDVYGNLIITHRK
jgi:N-methylhydantoinase A